MSLGHKKCFKTQRCLKQEILIRSRMQNYCVSNVWPLQVTSTQYTVNANFKLFVFCRNNEGLVSTDQVLRSLGLDPTPEDCVATQRVCQIVSTRAAHLCAATLTAVLRQIRDNKAAERLRTTIGVDGSVYKNHPL